MLHNMNLWDILLLTIVPLQASLLAYVHSPRAKGLLFVLPIPFTLATLAIGQPVGISNLAGLALLMVFMHGVRILYCRLKVPIILAIIISAVFYCVISMLILPMIPTGNMTAFVGVCFALIVGGILILVFSGHSNEPGHKSLLPAWKKIPIIFGVIWTLLLIKPMLGGFMTMFPMVGVVAAYEARKSLKTMCQQMAVMWISSSCLVGMMALLQHVIGTGFALAAGWVVNIAVIKTTDAIIQRKFAVKEEYTEI